MERRPEIGFASYDRFFPSQDTMPVGGFGNLIALPLQRRARELGNSVFIDQDLRPHDDQWAFLAARPRLSAKAAAEIVDDAETRGRILGVRMPVEDEDADEPWRMTPSRRPQSADGAQGPSRIPPKPLFRASCAISLSSGAGCPRLSARLPGRPFECPMTRNGLSLLRGAILERASAIKGATRYS